LKISPAVQSTGTFGGSVGTSFAHLQPGTGEIEVVSDVRNYVRDAKSNFAFADPARREFVSANGQHIMLVPVKLM